VWQFKEPVSSHTATFVDWETMMPHLLGEFGRDHRHLARVSQLPIVERWHGQAEEAQRIQNRSQPERGSR